MQSKFSRAKIEILARLFLGFFFFLRPLNLRCGRLLIENLGDENKVVIVGVPKKKRLQITHL